MFDGDVYGEINQTRECKGKEFEPEILQNQVLQKRNHFAIVVVVVVVAGLEPEGEAVLAKATAPKLIWSRLQKRASPIQLRDRAAGVTKTDVKNARNSSSVTPRTNCPR